MRSHLCVAPHTASSHTPLSSSPRKSVSARSTQHITRRSPYPPVFVSSYLHAVRSTSRDGSRRRWSPGFCGPSCGSARWPSWWTASGRTWAWRAPRWTRRPWPPRRRTPSSGSEAGRTGLGRPVRPPRGGGAGRRDGQQKGRGAEGGAARMRGSTARNEAGTLGRHADRQKVTAPGVFSAGMVALLLLR